MGLRLLSGDQKAPAITYLPGITDRATLMRGRRCQVWDFAMWEKIAYLPCAWPGRTCEHVRNALVASQRFAWREGRDHPESVEWTRAARR